MTVIDAAAPEKPPVTIAVGGTLEFGATDNAGRVFVNVEDKGEVAVIDAKQRTVIARWPVAPGESPSGLAIDRTARRLYVGCDNKTMVALDADSGKVLGSVPVGQGVDGDAFVPQLGLAMTANGKDATLTAARVDSAGQFTVVQTLQTVKGARTIAANPKTGRVYLPCMIPDKTGKTAFGLLVVGERK